MSTVQRTMTDSRTRDQIVEAADRLFYRQGFEHTSFSELADAVQISRGNFYHHFKTKNDILAAVIQRRRDHTQAQLARWERAETSAVGRIRSFIGMLIKNRADIQRYGCPVGTLCSELSKLRHPSQTEAGRLFTLFRDWLREQFEQLGPPSDADALAMHLLMRSQGVAMLASGLGDEAFLQREVRQMNDWLDEHVRRPH
jgi:TetR/AcrR family transcriptional regulator, transcriptional repressor for nem operon